MTDSTYRGTERWSSWNLLYLAASVTILVSMVFPWWDGTRPLSLETLWPRLTLSGGMAALLVGAFNSPRLNRSQAAIAAMVIVGVSLVGFCIKVDNSKFFSEVPFTVHVDIGFFVAALGAAWAFFGSIGLATSATSDTVPNEHAWRSPLLSLFIGSGIVLGLYWWSSTNAHSVTHPSGTPMVEAPEATAGRRPSAVGLQVRDYGLVSARRNAYVGRVVLFNRSHAPMDLPTCHFVPNPQQSAVLKWLGDSSTLPPDSRTKLKARFRFKRNVSRVGNEHFECET